MSLLREIMDDYQGVVNDALGHMCTLTNADTGESIELPVVINRKVELYQDGIFGGLVATGTFSRAESDPKIGDSLHDSETGVTYTLDGVKDETPSKLVFILGEL